MLVDHSPSKFLSRVSLAPTRQKYPHILIGVMFGVG